MAASHVALLRGINVGAHNRLPMPELRAIFEDAGCRNVEHFIQSGNILFEAPAEIARTLSPRVEATIRERYGFETPVILRSRTQLKALVAANPFVSDHAGELYVTLLGDKPEAAAVAALDAKRSAPDRYQLIGREIYMDIVRGAADTRLSIAYFERSLKTTCTARNWRTISSLLELVYKRD